MRLKNVLASCAVAAGLGVSAPIVMAAPSAPVAAQHTERASTVASQTPVANDAARYAAMEQQQPKAADFKGGDTVVIAMSSGAVIVAVILLVLLL